METTSFVGINRISLSRLQSRAWDNVNPFNLRNEKVHFSIVNNAKKPYKKSYCSGFCSNCTFREDSLCQTLIDIKVAEYLGVYISENLLESSTDWARFVTNFSKAYAKKEKKNPEELKAVVEKIVAEQVEETNKKKNIIIPLYEEEVIRLINENTYDGKTFAELHNIDGVHCQACECPNFYEGKCHRISNIYDCSLERECVKATVQISDFTRCGYTVESLRETAIRVDKAMENYYGQNRYYGD